MKWVNLHFQQFAAINADSRSFANNFGWVDQVFQDLFVDVGKGTTARSLLLDTGVAGRFGESTTLSNEDDVLVRELFLELSSQSNEKTNRSINYGPMRRD
jgi:hypothetical protein